LGIEAGGRDDEDTGATGAGCKGEGRRDCGAGAQALRPKQIAVSVAGLKNFIIMPLFFNSNLAQTLDQPR